MRGLVKGGVIGLGVGIVAAVLLAPKSRRDNGESSGSTLSADIADAVVDAAQAGVGAVQSILRRTESVTGGGILPDERLTLRIRDELEGLGLWSGRLDVTTVDGTVYLRGRETNAERADAVVHTIGGLEGVGSVVDEIRRE